MEKVKKVEIGDTFYTIVSKKSIGKLKKHGSHYHRKN